MRKWSRSLTTQNSKKAGYLQKKKNFPVDFHETLVSLGLRKSNLMIKI